MVFYIVGSLDPETVYLIRDVQADRWYGEFAYKSINQANFVAQLIAKEQEKEVQIIPATVYPSLTSTAVTSHLVLMLDAEGKLLDTISVDYDPLEKPNLLSRVLSPETGIDSLKILKIMQEENENSRNS